ncbi:MAG: DUF4905 domain-containing protein, partial [Bacteroidetes bacterium]|nr:DUF4905 domain-containing protein [Bacteroidota bacterium]
MSVQIIDLPAPVWQVRPCVQAPLLALELRDARQMEATFAVYHLHTRQLVPIVPDIPEWWVGLAAVGHDSVLLHRYEDPAMPVHQGVYAYNVHNGRLRWSHPHARYQAVVPGGFELVEAAVFRGCNPEGEWVDPYPAGKGLSPVQRFPGSSVHTDEIFAEMAARIAPHLGFPPQLQLEYLKEEDTEIWLALDAQWGAHL